MENTNDYIIESKTLQGAFWDDASEDYRDLIYADVFQTEAEAKIILDMMPNKDGFIRLLTDEEQAIFYEGFE